MEISAGIVFAVVVASLGSIISAVVAILTYLRMSDLEHSTNSKMDKLLELTAESSKAEGRKEAQDEAAGL